MEDALVQTKMATLLNIVQNSLNPCFNGRCTSTDNGKFQRMKAYEGLNPCFNGRCTSTLRLMIPKYHFIVVLILVLMEDALVHQVYKVNDYSLGLNPCFNGRCTSTLVNLQKVCSVFSLNPCFNGRCTSTFTEYSNLDVNAGLNPCFNGRCTSTRGL